VSTPLVSSQDLPADRVSAPAKRRILVIDDEVDIRESLELLMGGEGYQVDLADSGTMGLQKFDGGTYDLVLLDLMMPDRSGMDVLKSGSAIAIRRSS
jgi:DNA-binding response OmpR family regulator